MYPYDIKNFKPNTAKVNVCADQPHCSFCKSAHLPQRFECSSIPKIQTADMTKYIQSMHLQYPQYMSILSLGGDIYFIH